MEVYLYMLLFAIYFYAINKLRYNDKVEKLLLFILFVMLFIVSAIRRVGTDYNTYFNIYNNINNRVYDPDGIEIGYFYLNRLTKHLFGGEYTIFIVTSLIIIVLVYITIKKFSVDPLLSTILFMCMGLYLTSFNIIRQSIAIALILYSYKYCDTKTKWIVPILIASLFHKTALLVIPIYIICKIDLNKKHYFIIISIGILSFLFYEKTVVYLTNLMDSFQGYQDSVFVNEGANPIRTLISISILAFCSIGYNEIAKDKKMKIAFNMIIFGTIFSFFMLKGKIFARIVGYFDVFQILLIPYVLKNMNKYKMKKYSVFITTTIVACTSFYFYYTVKTNQAHVIPYRTYIDI